MQHAAAVCVIVHGIIGRLWDACQAAQNAAAVCVIVHGTIWRLWHACPAVQNAAYVRGGHFTLVHHGTFEAADPLDRLANVSQPHLLSFV